VDDEPLARVLHYGESHPVIGLRRQDFTQATFVILQSLDFAMVAEGRIVRR
jgi:hypothetical protein